MLATTPENPLKDKGLSSAPWFMRLQNPVYPPKTNVTIANGPFQDVFAMKNGVFSIAIFVFWRVQYFLASTSTANPPRRCPHLPSMQLPAWQRAESVSKQNPTGRKHDERDLKQGSWWEIPQEYHTLQLGNCSLYFWANCPIFPKPELFGHFRGIPL